MMGAFERMSETESPSLLDDKNRGQKILKLQTER
jgi:hypothetical protein